MSKYYKNKKYKIKLIKLGFNGYPSNKKIKIIDVKKYDKVLVSVIFTVNKNKFIFINIKNKKIIVGGTGTNNPKIKLPERIDNCDLDYSLYPENKKSYGFITRGCIRNCYFCFVPKFYKKIKFNKPVNKIIKHKEVEFLDDNFLAYKGHKNILRKLIKLKIMCRFSQGLDIRLIDDENAELLSKLNYIQNYTFAFDDIKYLNIVNKKLKIMKKYIKTDYMIRFYIYCNSNMNLKDIIFRILWCKRNKCLPYLMRDINCYNSKYKKFFVDLAAYCNMPNLFKKMNFDQFLKKRYKENLKRVNSSLKLWKKYV